MEVAAAQKKDQLISGPSQAPGHVLERRGKVEAAFPFNVEREVFDFPPIFNSACPCRQATVRALGS